LTARRLSSTSTKQNAKEASSGIKVLGMKQVAPVRGPIPVPFTVTVALLSLTIGFIAGKQSSPSSNEEAPPALVLPSGLPRTCCDDKEVTDKQKELFKTLKRIVGRKHVLDGRVETTETSQYLKGSRLGRGSALYIVKPTKLKQLLEIVQHTVDADCVILVQGQNTGLTGGSVPRDTQHQDERPTVIISMKDLNTIFPIDDGERVVCFAGAGLADLSNFVQANFPDRESHSILGSTFLNPTTAAGVSLGSGGTQCRKGPAFTERALYLKVVPDKFGKSVVKVVNRLGVEGFDQEEGEFDSHLRHDGAVPLLDRYTDFANGGHDRDMKKSNQTYGKEPASDRDYKNRLCQDDNKPSRYNADTKGCDCNRSEGKVLILASVHDTFPRPSRTKTFWISFDSLETTLQFRRQVCLDNPNDLPVSLEYMDRDSFDVIDRAGRAMGNVIKLVGVSSPLVKTFWNVKLWIEALDFKGAPLWIDKLMYTINPVVPSVLPGPIMKLGREKDHHVAMTVGDFDGSLDRCLERMNKFQTEHAGEVHIHECTSTWQMKGLDAFRFVAAPAFRTWCVGEGAQGFSVDYALPKNGGEAPPLSTHAHAPIKRMRYSHFGCNVVHEDLAFAPGVDIHEVKMQLKKTVEHKCGGKLPAEHGHGTEYVAPEETRQRWKGMDPLNVMNPGIGGLSSKFRYFD
jgi:D-lactate dehydrogenase